MTWRVHKLHNPPVPALVVRPGLVAVDVLERTGVVQSPHDAERGAVTRSRERARVVGVRVFAFGKAKNVEERCLYFQEVG